MVHDAVRVVRLDNPPVNALGQSLRSAVVEGIAAANSDPTVRAIVLSGTDKAFSAGADITEFGTPLSTAKPDFPEMLASLENSPKPVVAAVAGVCMGGGLELALAAHARVARPDARIALPEITLGVIPGAGGTQRLPRALPADEALDMILNGKARTAADLKDTGLFDAVDENVIEAAKALAEDLAEGKRHAVLLRDRGPDNAALGAAVARMRGEPGLRQATVAALDAVEAAADRPFDDGLALEHRLFAQLETSDDAKALRHAFFAERALSKPEGSAPKGGAVERVGIVGSGTMGRGIAISVAKAGIEVTMVDLDADALSTAREMIKASLVRDVEKSRVPAEKLDQILGRLGYAQGLDALASSDLIIEAVFEDMDVKLKVFSDLERICRPEAVLASNTSMLDIDRIAASTANPGRVVGLHFFSPANIMRLLEVVRGTATSTATLATAVAFARRIGKVPVIAGNCHGFIGNRMLEAYLDRAFTLIEEGVSPYAIDKALEDWGMAMGPFRILDLAGNDVSYSVRKTRKAMYPHVYISPLGEIMYLAGRLGQKSGGGWYDYGPDAPKGRPSPDVEALLKKERLTITRPQRTCAPNDIISELISALAREGTHILAEGHAASSSDIDIVYLYGYGFPRYRGGPMYYCMTHGLT